ncbi:MAG: sugar phosphate isomerase/epimerase [Caldilineaceae bacterium]|nr:sugar phosphate isomerase/epimerase [Caldilineaceae bacterium]
MPTSSRRVSVSTWSLHRTLGRLPAYGPDRPAPAAVTQGLPLPELPARLADAGIHTLEICHFHLPNRDPGYLDELRQAMAGAGVELWSLLVDGGDITDSIHAARDEAWIAGWLPVAQRLGAARMRVSAGKSAPSPATLAQSVAALRRLAEAASDHGLRLMTENWHSLMQSAAEVNQVLDALEGQLGLCVDFGNWSGPDKYDQLAAILPHAESCHAKCHFAADGTLDKADYIRCLDLTRAAGFAGPYTLIYDGPSADEWAGLGREQVLIQPYLTGA